MLRGAICAGTLALASVASTAAFLVACGSPGVASPPEPIPATEGPDADVDDAGSAPDAALRPAPIYQGSALCNALHWMGCYPDDPKSSTAQECNLAPDGGAYNISGGYDKAQLACHVQPASNDLGVAPVCTPAGPGGDGAPCTTSGDCGAAFECVGAGVCRHYCCADTCTGETFCDIQTSVDWSLKVPVCVPIRVCSLLAQPHDAGSCSPGDTCAVVRDNGVTSCVEDGPQQAGEECNTDHCAHGLSCIGNTGSQLCYRLCHTADKPSDCDAGQTCTGGLPFFPVPGTGICK